MLLTDRGWTGAAASWALTLLPAARLFALPAWAAAADRFGAAPVLRLSVSLATLCTIALAASAAGPAPFPGSPALAVGAMVGWSLARAPGQPIVDAVTVARVGADYGRIRAFGSIGFLLAAAAGGWLREVSTSGPVALSLTLIAVTWGITLHLPIPAGATLAPPSIAAAARTFATHPVLAPLVAVSVLHGAAIGIYDNLLAVHVEALQLPGRVIGWCVATGVGVEVVALTVGRQLLARIGPRRLVLLAVASQVPRFALTAVATDPVTLVAAQTLHGLGFGVYWVGATHLFADAAPPELRHSTQALLPSAMFGVGPLVGLPLGGWVLDMADSRALFGLAAVLSLGATVVAATCSLPSTPPPTDRT